MVLRLLTRYSPKRLGGCYVDGYLRKKLVAEPPSGGNLRDPGTSAPSVLRAACRARFYDGIQTLHEIASDDDAKDGDRIKAIEALGRFGLGAADQAQVHVHAEGNVFVGVIALPPLGESAPDGGEVGPGAGDTHASVDAPPVELGLLSPGQHESAVEAASVAEVGEGEQAADGLGEEG